MTKALTRTSGIAAICATLAVSFCGCGQGITKKPKRDDFTPEYVEKCKKLAERGKATFQEIYGRALHNGWGIASNQVESVEWFRKAAEQGLPRAQYNLGICFYKGEGIEKNHTLAVDWFRKAAEQNYADAQCNLGLCYENGNGVEKDEAKAMEWYRKAAEQGWPRAQMFLGSCYENGQCVEKDEAKAVEWYRKAADQENEWAERLLSLCYSEGRGVEKDEAKAVELMRRSAEHGLEWAQYNLGRYFEYGFLGLKRDTRSAIKWYLTANSNGCDSVELLYKLGNLYWNGAPSSDFQRDEGKAIEYWLKAARGGHEKAKKLFDAMEANPGWNYPFNHSSLMPDTKIDTFAGLPFKAGPSIRGIDDLGFKMTDDFHLVVERTRKEPFRKMDGMKVFLTPKTHETYEIHLFVEWPSSTFDNYEAAFVEYIATREAVTRRYGVLPEYRAEDKQNDNVTEGRWGMPVNPIFEFSNEFSHEWKLDGVTLDLSLDGKKITLKASDDELAVIAENERQSLLKKAKAQAASNDGGDML